MHIVLAAAAFAAGAAALPAELFRRDTFSLPQVASGTYLKAGPVQMMKTYRKYAKVGAQAPSDVQAAAAAAVTGSVVANPEAYDQAYLCSVSVGSQTLKLDFDTGSSDLWVFSSLLPSSQQSGHVLYRPGATASRQSGETWNIQYGDGSGAKGVVYADKVNVGGVTATSQAVEAATSVSSQFVSDPADGLLGLAFSSINTVQPQKQLTFFDSVKSSLSKALFTADLKHGTAGEYTFGFIDSSRYTGSITYVPVDNSQGFWQFTAGGGLGTSIADTGTSLLYLPASAVQSYYGKVSGAKYDSTQGGYTFPCRASLPNYQVSIGSATFTVPGSYINYAPIDSTGTTCFGGIQANTGIGFNIFGDVFLKSVYVVFDVTQGSPRLGFAKQ